MRGLNLTMCVCLYTQNYWELGDQSFEVRGYQEERVMGKYSKISQQISLSLAEANILIYIHKAVF